MIPVNSEAIIAVGYDGTNLHITYRGGGKTYIHPGVHKSTYESLLASDSKGKFIAKHIRVQHPGRPLAAALFILLSFMAPHHQRAQPPVSHHHRSLPMPKPQPKRMTT